MNQLVPREICFKPTTTWIFSIFLCESWNTKKSTRFLQTLKKQGSREKPLLTFAYKDGKEVHEMQQKARFVQLANSNRCFILQAMHD